MRTIKLTIEYDGTNYCGWQTQKNGISIQETIRKAIHTITDEDATLIGASRTDAGVHALGQVAHFRTKSPAPCEGFLKGLNSLLPRDMRIVDVQDVPKEFHALRDARGKHYRYIISTNGVPSALYNSRVWHVHQPIDIGTMKRSAKMLVGKHDFSAFRAAGSHVKDAVRTIHSIGISRMQRGMKGIPCPVNGIAIDVLGDGFVRHMIRNIAGWLVEAGRGRISLDEARRIFKGKKRTEAGVCAPASGLYLMEVFY
jgi:tRNA pseudouridine38-40 synthase